jgi:hypothetical protein
MAVKADTGSMNSSRSDIVIRRADASDARALWRLAALDDAPAPRAFEAVLLAEADGQIVAAVGPDRAIADPFRRTAEIVDLLELRAAQLAASEVRRSRRPRLPRLIPHPLPQS